MTMPCASSIASALTCWGVLSPGEEGLRAMFKNKCRRSRRVRPQSSSEKQQLLDTGRASATGTVPPPKKSVSFAAFCTEAAVNAVDAIDAVNVDALQLPAELAPPRQTSRLLLLPREIRDEIYGHIFRDTRLAMGRRITCSAADSAADNGRSQGRHQGASHVHVTRVRPARNALALFSVCRQTHDELQADDAWLGQVLFDFADVATMLDVLGGTSGGARGSTDSVVSPLADPARRARVRQVRVREGGLARTTPHRGDCGFLLGGLMRLLPGLRLDRLTILPAQPCRVHGAACCFGGGTGGGNGRVASHEVLAELLRAGQGWRELCYVHYDVGMLIGRRPQPQSVPPEATRETPLEAMMVNLGFWDADANVDDDVFALLERRGPTNASRLGSVFAAYSDAREYRLPAWKAMLAARDSQAAVQTNPSSSRTTPSSVRVYSVRNGLATYPMRTLADVHMVRLRRDDFMVVVRRDDGGVDGDVGQPDACAVIADAAYPFARADPRTLGYGTTWSALRSFLFPWDYVPETRSRRDRYVDRDEYVVGPLPRHHRK